MASPDKLNRWLDLIAALLKRRFPAAFADLRADVPAYQAVGVHPDSILRTFERDKDELRVLGVAIESLQDTPGGEVRYRLRGEDFYLPFLLLGEATRPDGVILRRGPRMAGPGYERIPVLAISTDDHLALVRAALRVQALGHPALAADANAARRKLSMDLVDPELRATVATVPGAPRATPAIFDLLGRALDARKVVTFTYHSMGRDVVGTRTAEPYGLVYVTGHWYLVARDADAGALRRFRLSRMAAGAPRHRRRGVCHPRRLQPARAGAQPARLGAGGGGGGPRHRALSRRRRRAGGHAPRGGGGGGGARRAGASLPRAARGAVPALGALLRRRGAGGGAP